jgi:hypothetical protein
LSNWVATEIWFVDDPREKKNVLRMKERERKNNNINNNNHNIIIIENNINTNKGGEKGLMENLPNLESWNLGELQ